MQYLMAGPCTQVSQYSSLFPQAGSQAPKPALRTSSSAGAHMSVAAQPDTPREHPRTSFTQGANHVAPKRGELPLALAQQV